MREEKAAQLEADKAVSAPRPLTLFSRWYLLASSKCGKTEIPAEAEAAVAAGMDQRQKFML